MIRPFLLLGTMFFSATVYAQEMRFITEKSCTSQGTGLSLKCRNETQEFTLVKSGNKYVGINPTGSMFELKLIESTPYILVLQNPVSFDGTSMLHITPIDGSFYWVEVAYSTILKKREVTIQSGRRLR